MNKQLNWMERRLRLGWVLLGAGMVVALFGLALPRWIGDSLFNTRIVTGLGILLIGIGFAYVARYSAARRDTQAAARMVNEERDERTQALRARAGNRAYWVSTALAYAGLMWVSFAANGSLPAISQDALWYYLAAVVILPFGVYATSLMVDQARR